MLKQGQRYRGWMIDYTPVHGWTAELHGVVLTARRADDLQARIDRVPELHEHQDGSIVGHVILFFIVCLLCLGGLLVWFVL